MSNHKKMGEAEGFPCSDEVIETVRLREVVGAVYSQNALENLATELVEAGVDRNDIALMADDLQTLPFAVGLSRKTSRIIRLNLWFSLGVVALLIPATLFGLGIGPAVLVHEGSTLVVVANALRLLAFKDRRDQSA